MSPVHARFLGLCMRRAVGGVRVRVRSPSSQHYVRKTTTTATDDESNNFFNKDDSNQQYFSSSLNVDGEVVTNQETDIAGNRVMVVVDSSLEPKTALQWTLSHTVQTKDTIFLLHIVNPSKQGTNYA